MNPVEQSFEPSMITRARVAELRRRLERGEPISAVVVGAGRSGRAAVALLAQKGASVSVVDDRACSPEEIAALGCPVALLTAEALSGADLVVLSPGVPRLRPELTAAHARGVVVGELELASWFVRAPLVGITGTNGKSTTTALTAHLLRESGLQVFEGGNLGRPLSELVTAGEAVDVAVVELSSYQLESLVEAVFQVACWLNLTPDHTDRYVDLTHYARAKERIIDCRAIQGTGVLNAKDPATAEVGIRRGGRLRWFSASSSSELASSFGTRLVDDDTALRVVEGGPDETYALANPRLVGLHNRANMCAAIENARLSGATIAGTQAGLRSFRGLPHRLELIRELGGVRYYNDSKATNVDSARIALLALGAETILIAGGRDKGASWAPLADIARTSVVRVLAIGEATPIVKRSFDVPVEECGTLEQAVARAHRLAAPGQNVLLSPACASFDQFKNYEQRGDVFRALVTALSSATEVRA